MTIFSNTSAVAIASAVVILALPSATSFAATTSNVHTLRHSKDAAVVKVHGSWHDDDDDGAYYRVYHRHHDRDEVVDAPFTHVESGRRVVVDAPFAHVAVNRNGRHIVAPFVNIWVPRY